MGGSASFFLVRGRRGHASRGPDLANCCYLCAVSRILAIDYGEKRTGLAVTDPLRLIASGLATVPTTELEDYLQAYLALEPVETIVIGEPFHADGNPTALTPRVHRLGQRLKQLFPQVRVVFQDEAFTSTAAREAIRQSGAKRKKRRDKALVDKIAAAIILQEYLEATKY